MTTPFFFEVIIKLFNFAASSIDLCYMCFKDVSYLLEMQVLILDRTVPKNKACEFYLFTV